MTIAHNVPYFFHLMKIKIKTILITHPHNFYFRKKISNNPLYIFFHLINSTITGRFFKVIFA